MLARTFLTPAELNISDQQFEALLKVLGMLERGELVWHKQAKESGASVKNINRFNMGSWSDSHCGTVGCIGFWAEKVGKVPLKVGKVHFSSITVGTRDLFYNHKACDMDTTPEEGAEALRNYLSTGKADWDDVLGHKG